MAKKAKKSASAKPPTKTEIQTQIAESTGLSKKEVASVFNALAEVIGKNLSKRGTEGLHPAGSRQVQGHSQEGDQGSEGHQPLHG